MSHKWFITPSRTSYHTDQSKTTCYFQLLKFTPSRRSRRRLRRPGRRRCGRGHFCFDFVVPPSRRPNKREYIGLDRLFTTTSESEIIRKNAGITMIPASFNLVAGGRFELPTFGLWAHLMSPDLSSQSKPKRTFEKFYVDLTPTKDEITTVTTVIQDDTGNGEGREAVRHENTGRRQIKCR